MSNQSIQIFYFIMIWSWKIVCLGIYLFLLGCPTFWCIIPFSSLTILCVCVSVTKSPFSFLVFFYLNHLPFFLGGSSLRFAYFIFSKIQHLVSLMFSIVFIILISFNFAVIFIMFSINLGLYSFSSFFNVKFNCLFELFWVSWGMHISLWAFLLKLVSLHLMDLGVLYFHFNLLWDIFRYPFWLLHWPLVVQ